MAISPKKVKSSTSGSRFNPEHPPLWVMLKAAIGNLKDRKGSSRQAIMKYIQSNYKVQMNGKFRSAMKRCINKAISESKLVKTKGSFKLSIDEKVDKKPKLLESSKVKRSVGPSKKTAKPKIVKKPKIKIAKPTVATGVVAVGGLSKKPKKSIKSKKIAKPKGAAKK